MILGSLRQVSLWQKVTETAYRMAGLGVCAKIAHELHPWKTVPKPYISEPHPAASRLWAECRGSAKPSDSICASCMVFTQSSGTLHTEIRHQRDLSSKLKTLSGGIQICPHIHFANSQGSLKRFVLVGGRAQTSSIHIYIVLSVVP